MEQGMSIHVGKDDISKLFTIHHNFYPNDNYHSRKEDNIPTEVLMLKRRYNDYFNWKKALDVYYNYMYELGVRKYFNYDVLKDMIDRGDAIDDYIPPKPKLKKTKKNRFLKKLKITLSEVGEKSFYDSLNLENLDCESEEFNAKIDSCIVKLKNLPPEVADVVKRQVIKKKTTMSGLEYLMHYMNMNGKYSSKEADSIKSINEFAKYQEDEARKDKIEESRRWNQYVQDPNGRGTRTAKEQRDLEVAQAMLAHGFDISNIKGMVNEKTYKLVKSQAGYGNISKKKIAKLKKKEKKKRKEQEKVLGILSGGTIDSSSSEEMDATLSEMTFKAMARYRDM